MYILYCIVSYLLILADSGVNLPDEDQGNQDEEIDYRNGKDRLVSIHLTLTVLLLSVCLRYESAKSLIEIRAE